MPQHKDIDDSNRHEPKGASTASSGQVLTSNGDGTTSFADLPTTDTTPYKLAGSDTLSGKTSVTISGVPSTATSIKLTFSGATFTGTPTRQPFIRLGNSSGVFTTGYTSDALNVAAGTSLGDTSRLTMGDTSDIFGGRMNGTVYLDKNSSGFWCVSSSWAAVGMTARAFIFSGNYDESVNGAPDRVQFGLGTGSFAAGNVTVRYME